MSKETTQSRTIVITGGNSGLGYECAKNIACDCKADHIILACRSTQKSNEAVRSLVRETGNQNIRSLELDLSSLESVRHFARKLISLALPPLFAIVCNAGVQIGNGTEYTTDGFEMTFGVNHLGHFLLVNLLLDEMSDPGRIIFVSSDTHDPLQKTGMPEPLYENARWLAYPNMSTTTLSGAQRYTTSKLCNLYCTYKLADLVKRHDQRNITINAFDPGMMPGTGLARNYNYLIRFAWKYILPVLILVKSNVNTVTKSGKALATLITDPKLSNTTAKYFEGEKQVKSSLLSYNKDNREDLWQTSVELTCLKQTQ